MKNINIVSIIVLMFFSISVQSQLFSGKITYSATLLKSQNQLNLDTIKSSKGAKKLMKNLFNNDSEISYILTFYNNKSLFQKKKEIEIKKNILLEVRMGKGSFYYDRELNDWIYKRETYGETFLISYPETKWKITNETKKINGYLCGKAITTIVENSRVKQTSIITAWFAFDLPYNFGPKQFAGLPGLVLELEYAGKYKMRATKIELNPKEKIKIKLPKKGIKISLEKYEKKMEEMFVKRRIRRQN